MRKKKGHRYNVSYSSLNDNKSMNVKFATPMLLDIDAIERMMIQVCECQLNDIWYSQVGYIHPVNQANYNYITLTITGRYVFGGKPYTTERIILKHVRKEFIKNRQAIESYFKDIYNSTFEIKTFNVAYR